MLQGLRATCVLMLLISINLLSMHHPKLDRKLVKKEEKKYKDVLLNSPSSVPYFKQQSITLQNNNADQYSLIFNRQQPCITQYLLGGNPVAQLIQIDDEINFKSNDFKTCNFSLQIPYRAGSLTINTQGRFIFEKKVDAYSAYLTCKDVDFREGFSSNNGLIIEADSCKNQAQLTCSDFLFKGKEFEVAPKSSLNAHNSLTLMAQSLISNQGTIDCSKESFIQSFLLKNSGRFISSNMYFNGNEVVNVGALTIGDSFHCASKLFDHRGTLDVSGNCVMEKGDVFSSTASSVFNVQGNWKAFIDSFILSGSLSVKDLDVVGKNFTAEQPLHCIAENAYLKIEEDVDNAGVIKVFGKLDIDSKNITLEETSCITADNASLEVDELIHNEGSVSVKQHLSARAHYMSNAGKIKSNSSDIKADYCYYNIALGSLNAKNNLIINTPIYFNLFGLINAKNLTINSAIGLNAFGISAAKNMSLNSLFSLNAGLLLPKFDALSELYSPENMWRVGEFLFTNYVPFLGKIYAALKSIKGTLGQGSTLYDEIDSLRKQKNIGKSDVIALLCSIKSMISSARQTYQLGTQNYHLLSDVPQSNNTQNSASSSDVVTKVKDVAQQAVSTIASHYAPSVTTTSMIDYNYGVATGINNHSANLYHRNANVSIYAQNTIDTRCGENTGYLGAYNLNVKATSSYDLDGNTRVSDGNVEAYYLKTNGSIDATKSITLQGKGFAYINSDIAAQKTVIKSDGYAKINSYLSSADTHVHAKVIDQHGVITSQQVVMNGDRIKNYGTIEAPKTIITQANLPRLSRFDFRDPSYFHNQGSIQASEQLIVDAGNIELCKESKIASPNAYLKSDASWQNDGNIIAEQLVLDAKTTMTNNGFLQAPKIMITQGKSEDNGWLANAFAFHNTGSIQASEQLFVDAKNIKLHESSGVDTPNAYFKSDRNWQNDGNITGKQLVLDIKRDGTNSGFIEAPKMIIIQGKSTDNDWRANSRTFHNTGSMQVPEQLFVDAKNIKLHESSEVDAPNAYFKSDGNWQNDGNIIGKQLVLDIKKDGINSGSLQAPKIIINPEKSDDNGLNLRNFHNTGNIQASDQFFVNAKNIKLHESSEVDAPNAYFKSDGNWQNDGNIAGEQLVLDIKKDGTNNGSLQVPKVMITQGKSNDNDRYAHLRAFRNTGSMHVSEQLFVDVNSVKLDKKSVIDAPNTYFKTDRDWQNDGTLKTEQCIIDAQQRAINNGTINSSELLHIKAENILFHSKSHVKSKDACYEADQDVCIDGVMDVERGSVDAGGKVRAIGKIGASEQLDIKAKDIIIQESSHVSADTAVLKSTQTICNQGTLATSKLSAHANYVTNFGTINSNNAHIKADRCFLNACGSVNVEDNLSIDTIGLFNVLGYISANSINTNSIVDSNLLGVYVGKNICQNSCLSYNVGLWLPKAKSLGETVELAKNDPGKFARTFVLPVAEKIILPFVPRLATIYSVVKTAGMLCTEEGKKASLLGRAKSLKENIDKLREKEDLCASDVVPVVCQANNIVVSTIQTVGQIYDVGEQVYQNRQEIYDVVQPLYQDGKQLCQETKQAHQKGQLLQFAKERVSDAGNKVYQSGQTACKEIYGAVQPLYQDNKQLYQETQQAYQKGQLLQFAKERVSDAGNKVYQSGQTACKEVYDVVQPLYQDGKQLCQETKQAYQESQLLQFANEKVSYTREKAFQLGQNAYQTTKEVIVPQVLPVASTVVSLVGPQLSRNSLLDINNGLMLGANGSSQSLYSMNNGLSCFVNNNVSTVSGTNNGFIGGGNVSVNAAQTYSSAGIVTGINASMAANNLNLNERVIVANNLNLNARNKANIDADVSGRNIHITAKEVELKKENVINACGGTAHIVANTIANESVIKGNAVYMQAKIVRLQDSSDIRTQGGDNTVAIKAEECFEAKSGSVIHGGDVKIAAASFQGDVGNSITSTNQTLIKTAHLDNQGVVSGVMVVDFAGNSSQLKGIGTVDRLQYYGTLENGLADALAEGKSDLVNVTQSGSVTLFAGNQKVHLVDEHTMNHALKIESFADVKCDKKLSSSAFVDIKTKGNLEHKSIAAGGEVSLGGRNIIARANVIRTGDGINYEDNVEDITVTGSGIEAHATENLLYQAVKTHSGKEGTTMTAGGKNISAAAIAEKHTESYAFNNKTQETETPKDTFITTYGCEHASEGIVTVLAGDTVELDGTTIDSRGGKPIIYGNNGVNGYEINNIHLHESEYTKKGRWFGSDKHNYIKSESTIAKTVDFIGGNTPEIISNSHISMPFTSDSERITLNAPLVNTYLAKNRTLSYSKKDWANIVWESEKSLNKEDVTYSPSFTGIIETNAEKIYCEEVKGHAAPIYETTHNDVVFTRNVLEETHEYQKHSLQKPTKATACVVAMAITMLTSGIGSSAGATMATVLGCKSAVSTAFVSNATAAAITTFSTQAADALLRCNGDFSAAAKNLASTKALKNLVLSMGTAGAMGGAGQVLNKIGLPAVKDAHNLGERLMYAAPRQLTNATIKTVVNVIAGQEFKDTVKHNMQSALADTIGVACTSQIGDAYAKEQIGSVSHKVLHTGVGIIEGGIVGGVDGALAGGISAFTTEMVADVLAPEAPSLDSIREIEVQIGRRLTQEEFTQVWNDQMSTYWQGASSTADISRFAAASVALLSRQDVDITNTVSSTAIDNNFLILAGYGLITAGAAYSAYQINNAYQEGGPEAALKRLGIEIGLYVIGAGVVKVGFKVGCVMYPSAKVAIAVVLEETPALKFALGELIDILTLAGEAAGQSALGKSVSVVENHLVNTTNKITQRISESVVGESIAVIEANVAHVADTVTQKLGNVGANFAENLVDHVVPAKVLNTVEAQLAGTTVEKCAQQLMLPAPEKFLLLPVPEKVLALPVPEKILALPAPEKLLALPAPVVSMEAQVGKQVVEKAENTIAQNLGNMTRQDLVMTTPEGIKISVPDTGEAGLFQKSDNIGELVNKEIKSVASSIEKSLGAQATQNAAKVKNAAKVESKTVVSQVPSINAENSGIIKNDLRATIQRYEKHIFSKDHEKRGILALGESKEVIMDKLYDVTMFLDKKGLLQEGDNMIKATINGVSNVEIKCHIKNGEAISANAYISDFNRIYGNFVDATKVLK